MNSVRVPAKMLTLGELARAARAFALLHDFQGRAERARLDEPKKVEPDREEHQAFEREIRHSRPTTRKPGC